LPGTTSSNSVFLLPPGKLSGTIRFLILEPYRDGSFAL
jgi:hypothetical protein